ncbi:MAG: transposase [Pseudoxanthomonas sp.]
MEQVDLLRDSVRKVKQRHPFDILGWVVLPEHMHALWTLPEGDGDCAMRWMLIKAGFSRKIAPGERIRASRRSKGERGIGQRRFWEQLIVDDGDLQRHREYIHINPVKHGHVARPSDWSHSSIHRYIREGELAKDWSAPPESEVTHAEK